MIGSYVRRWGFWTLDLLKGGEIREHYKDIKNIVELGGQGSKRAEEYLYKLLNHAVETTEYYSSYKKFKSIKDFPIINKNIIRENQSNIMSSDYIGKKLHSMSTSGSTGTPFTIYQDLNKRKRVLAEIIYFGEICGYKLGDKNTFLRVWTEDNKKSKFDEWKQNLVMIDISNLDKKNLEKIRNILKKEKIKCILGYATSLDILCKYLLEKEDSPDMFNVDIVISGAEILNETTRINLRKVFGCNVVSRYSNQENGILAQELVDSDYFVINNASYWIEFLKIDSDVEADIGELSRVVVTDLFNYATPVIRYDTGDIAVVEKHDKYDKVIKRIEGRKRDFIYNTSGELISPSAVSVNMWKFNKVKQFQLIQNDKYDYVLKLNGAKGIYDDIEIKGLFKSILGEDANIKIEHIEGIPLLSSGKFQITVCNYRKDN